MVEIYLFVNPLGGVCLEIEKEIIQLSVNDKKKIQLRFIPLLNMKTINEFLSRHIFRLMTLNDGIEFLKIYTQPLLTIKQHSYKAEKKADNC